MNYPTYLRHPSRSWRKDLQFAVGIMVAVGGAAVLLSEVARFLSERI